MVLEFNTETLRVSPGRSGRNILETGLLLTIVLRTGELQGDRLRHRDEAAYALTADLQFN